MSKPNQPEEAPKAVETETTTELSTEAESNQTPAVEAETPETPETQLSDADDTTDPRAECKRFVAEFGAESGGEMYAEGLTFAQAQQKHSKKLSEENTALKARLDSIDRGEDDPAQLDDTGAELSEFDQKKQKFGKHLSNTPATLAACIKLPG